MVSGSPAVLSKILVWSLGLVLLARLLLLPRFRHLKEKLDRVVNATLIALLLVYGGRLLLLLTAR
ncbi:MAG TPA: hypothetical protein VLC09_02750 [Polyangiaceae bacterium]|nr:hypothetical protein [Polyangiaceae bacterium]